MKKILFILSLLVFQSGYSQLNIDSLFKVSYNEEESDSNRLYAMWTIAYDYYLFNNPDSSLIIAQEMYDLAKEKGKPRYQYRALSTQGSAYYFLGKLDLALKSHKKALKIHQSVKNDSPAIAVYNNIANVYREQGKQGEAIVYFMKALKAYEKLDDKIGISTVLGNIGSVYSDMDDYVNAKNYYRKALFLKKEIDDKIGLSLMLSGIGQLYLKDGMLDSAMICQFESYNISKKQGNKNRIAYSLKHIGEVYAIKNQTDSALFYFKRSLVIFEELDMDIGIGDVSLSLAEIFEKQENANKAMIYATKAYEIANTRGFVDFKRDASLLLYKLYKKKGNYIAALKMHENYLLMKDSVTREANQKTIIKQDLQYKYDKKTIADSLKHVEEKTISNLKHQKETEKQDIVITAITIGIGLLIVFLVFVFNRLRITRKQKTIIEEQKEIVEEKNQEITDSINYAKRIQSAILPPAKVVAACLKESFILYKPKDIVAGDFYWLESVAPISNKKETIILFAAADCTGHGVPGAMVSVVCNNALNRSVREHGLTDPGEILDKTREIVIQEFEKSDEDVKDGMDIALCSLAGNQLQYAGAHNPLWILRNGEIMETKANKQPIGQFINPLPYTTHTFELQKGDSIYIFSDGYVDQFGGEKGKKFKVKAFRDLLLSIQDKTMEEQKTIINDSFETWKGNLDQIDDVCIIGVRI